MSTTHTFRVEGMTCEHCVASVREEVSLIPGVTVVDVDLATGRLTVTAEGELDDEVVHAAVRNAGYDIEPPPPPSPTSS